MYNQLQIPPISPSDQEILRYLGYGGQVIEPQLLQQLHHCKRLVLTSLNPRFVCQSFSLIQAENEILLATTKLALSGKDIAHLLSQSDQCLLLAATLGTETERLINYHQKISIKQGVLLDAVATAAIENFCDLIQQELQRLHPLTQRFSCGYGDLPLSLQPTLLEVLQTNKTIGLFCNAQNILTPRKSVTAIMGILPWQHPKLQGEALTKKASCQNCPYQASCTLKKGGTTCATQRILPK